MPGFGTLEPRRVLNGSPVAQDDLLFATAVDTSLVGNVLTNDFDAEGTALSLPASQTGTFSTGNGQITVTSNGAFTYVPNLGFQGVDAWFYQAYDGITSSRYAKASFVVGSGLSQWLNRDERIANNPLHSGGLRLVQPLSDGQQLIYGSDLQGSVVVPVEVFAAPGTPIPTSITAQLAFGGIDQGTATYSNANFVTGQAMRFALQATDFSTGQYNWSMTLTLVGSGAGGTNLVQVISGSQAVVDRRFSEYGPGWWMDGQDRLIVQNGISGRPNGALLVEGDGTTVWFPANGSSWNRAEGDLTFSTLANDGSGYRLTDKWGNERRFDSQGRLVSLHPLSDLDTPTRTWSYEAGGLNRLVSITDQFGRAFTLNWSQPNMRVVCTGPSGRHTDVGMPDVNGIFGVEQSVSSVVINGNGPNGYDYYSPVTQYGTLPGPNGVTWCVAVTLPSQPASGGPVAHRTYEFDSFGLLKKIKYHNLGTAANETHSVQLFPTWKQGLRGATSGNSLHLVSTDSAGLIDERGKFHGFTTNRFGNITRSVEPNLAQWNFEFDWYGQLFRVTAPDPDGAGAQVAPVTKMGYDWIGNLVVQQLPADASTPVATLKWTWHATLNRPLTSVDALNQTTSMTWDSGGNLLSSTDPQGHTWTWLYDEQLTLAPFDGLHGRLRSATSPDPDGAGPLQPISTSFEYTGLNYMLPTLIVNGDGTSRSFEYNSMSDMVVSSSDELGRDTAYTWDDMDRLIVVTLPAVNGPPVGDQVNPQWKFVYGQNGQRNLVIDPENNITSYQYDARYRMVSQTLPDPDLPAGGLSSPVYTWSYNQTGQVIKATSPEYASGVADFYAYDDNGRMTTHTGPSSAQYPGGQITSYTWDALDRLVSVQDPSGRIQSMRYDVRSRMVGSRAEASANERLFVFDAADRMIATRDELFRQTDYQFTPNGWLDKVFLPDPDLTGPQTRSTWDFNYDALGRQTETIDPLGRITATAFDSRDRVISVTLPDPDGAGSLPASVLQYGYDLVGNLTSLTSTSLAASPLVRVTGWQYDALDRVTSVTLPDPDGPGGQTSPVWQYSSYDKVGNVLEQIDPLGQVTSFEYDNLYRTVQVTQPAGTGYASPVWNWTYDDRTLLASTTDPLAHVTSWDYDPAGRTTSVTMPGTGAVYGYAWDALDRLISVTEPAPDAMTPASVTQYQYDLRSRLTQVTDPRGGLTNYTWNDASELVALTDPSGNTTQWSYDRLGRTVLETNSLGKTRASAWDLNSNLVRATDRNGRIVKFALDQMDRLTTEQWYTASGTIPTVSTLTTTDGGGGSNEVQVVKVTQMSSGSPGTFVLAFDGFTTKPIAWNANAITVRNALIEANPELSSTNISVSLAISGGLRNYTLSFFGSLANQNLPTVHGAARRNADPATADRTLQWDYDEAGRLASASDPSASYVYSWDKLDRMLTETATINGIAPQVRLTRGYDAIGNRTSLAADFISGATTTADFVNSYSFDANNRLQSMTQSAQGSGAGFHAVQDKLVTFAYNALGQFTFVSRYESLTPTGTNLRTVFGYDSTNRLQNLSHRNIGVYSILSDYVYSYDNQNRITQINHTAAVTAHADGISDFNYDLASQLTAADHAPARPDENLAYDANGNRTGSGYTTGSNNQTMTDGTYTYIYDGEGNRLQRTKLSDGTYETYTWDHRNRLTRVDFKSSSGTVFQTVIYEYDIFNRLLKRRLDSNGPAAGGVTDTYFAGYDGINPTLQFETAGGTTAQTTDLKHRYLWGPVVDQLFADEQLNNVTTPGNTLWALSDHLGTIRDIADFDGSSFAIVNHRVFNSFGVLTAETNTAIDMAFAYTGKLLDETTGLSLHWHRWYDPNLGKWISEDPIGFLGGDANLGRYVRNSSTLSRDTLGLMDEPWWRDSYWDIIQPWSWLGNVSEGLGAVALGDAIGRSYAWDPDLDRQRRVMAAERAHTADSRETSQAFHDSRYATEEELDKIRILATANYEFMSSVSPTALVGTVSKQSGQRILAAVEQVQDAKPLSRLEAGVAAAKPSQRIPTTSTKIHTYVNDGRHVPGQPKYIKGKSVLPENHVDLFSNSMVIDGPDGPVRWTREGSGKKAVYHRFEISVDGEFHWNGSTNSRLPDGHLSSDNLTLNIIPKKQIDAHYDGR